MAWLETRGRVFRIRFRFGTRKHLLALHTTDPREARETLARFESNLRLIERGILEPPPATADVGTYIISGGKLAGRPSQTPRADVITLDRLFTSYLAEFPRQAKEVRTWKTEATHLKHLRRLLDVTCPLAEVTPRDLQAYVDARVGEPGKRKKQVGRETVQKEIGTFSVVWNKWAIPQGYITTPPPIQRLVYPKGRTKPPFQVREQIERQLAARTHTREEAAELWQSLFLTLPETEEFLDFIRDRKRQPYVDPMIVIAAHTGARRSEIRRALVTDFDFVSKTVMIREKKKDSAKIETFRTVPMSPRLDAVMRDWFARHPGGPFAICTPNQKAMSDHYTTKVFLQAVRNSRWSVLPGWHCLRHSFISNCVARGVDQRLIDQWVGHTTEAMRKRYSHLVPAVSQAALLSVFGSVGETPERRLVDAV